MHLYGEEFLDALIAEENLLEGKILLKGHLGSCSRLETYQCNDKELLVFLGITISMELIIKKSMKVFWNTKDWSQKPTSFVLQQFLLESISETSYPNDATLNAVFSRK